MRRAASVSRVSGRVTESDASAATSPPSTAPAIATVPRSRRNRRSVANDAAVPSAPTTATIVPSASASGA